MCAVRKSCFIALLGLTVLIGGALLFHEALADPIAPEHRSCAQDTDCDLIVIGCQSCKNDGSDGDYDAVNKAYFRQYYDKLKCTHGVALSCAIIKEPQSSCQSGQCRVHWKNFNESPASPHAN